MNSADMLQDVLADGFKKYKKSYVALIIATVVAMVGSILIITIPPLFFGLYYMALQVAKGKSVQVKDVFKGFDYFLQSWAMFLLALIAISIGLVLLVIPGLLLIVVLQYAVFVALNEKKGSIDSLKRSYEIGKKNLWFSVMLLVLLSIINGFAGSIETLGVVVYPFTLLATGVAYLKIK